MRGRMASRRIIVTARDRLVRFCFLAGSFLSLGGRTELGARLRRGAITRAETRFLDLSDYNCDSRSFWFRAHVEPYLACLHRRHHRRRGRCLFITPDGRERRYEGDTTGDAWRYLAPPRRLFVPFVYGHCAASRSPDYRDKQPEKPR